MDDDDDSLRPSDPEFLSERPTMVDPLERISDVRVTTGPKNRALLTVLTGPEKGTVHKIPDDVRTVTIGRSDEAAVCIADQSLSRVHATLERSGYEFLLSDAGSTNGTFFDEYPVRAPVRVGAGARIRLGARTLISLSFHDALEEAAALSVHEAALRDRLTGVYNRGVFDDRLAAEVAFAQRHETELSLLLFDIDHFKSFNDQHGHQAGDEVLISVGKKVRDTVRTEDIVARYGGEEFAVIARGTPTDKALVLGERIRSAIEQNNVPVDGALLRVTASIGISTFAQGADAPRDEAALIAAADRALYLAKDRGRNQVAHAAHVSE